MGKAVYTVSLHPPNGGGEFLFQRVDYLISDICYQFHLNGLMSGYVCPFHTLEGQKCRGDWITFLYSWNRNVSIKSSVGDFCGHAYYSIPVAHWVSWFKMVLNKGSQKTLNPHSANTFCKICSVSNTWRVSIYLWVLNLYPFLSKSKQVTFENIRVCWPRHAAVMTGKIYL